ncbi:retrovirus-related Pol polyprotein from transposon 17.6 [Trichonephila inaurata madagascariensis]|uniref:Retrovirus-related Pol polyprotein from transposon 17.6 n=1 Tax=Trichonephila inaurata madagascariensis TaxID=2747483 RepID=A0A8X6YZD7_9ARAC|nr:retrovirus-related Pol polyprotein from transposon 17.6 [Trichonephila inaurata madagascariensis]
MANNLPTIPAFKAGTNPSESWRHWKEDFEDYLEALRYSEAPEKTKTALFRHLYGEELKKQLRVFDLKPNDGCEGVTLQQFLQEFDKYFLDYQNEVFASFKFLEIKQEQGEKFTDYYSRLRNAVVECNYDESQDRMLRDKLIEGLLDKALQKRLIRETSKKARALQEMVSECKTAERTVRYKQVQASVMNEKLTVNALKNFKNNRKQSIDNQKNEFNCKQCGKKQEKKKCPAFGTKCRNCDGRNHWAKMYRTQSKRKNMAARRVNAMEENSENSDTIYIGELKSVNELDAKETNCVCKNGLGAVLLQEGQPVAYGSVSLTLTQQRYAQIEKELMAVIYGLEHFNHYTYGRIVTIQTDHKPILGLSKKLYDTISPRLQRQEATVRINLLTQASPTKWEEIASLTAGDPEMQDVLFHINNGWPQKKKTKIAAPPYWHCKEELYSTKEGIICRGHTHKQRLVVPVKYRKEILKLLHVSHKGKEHLLMIDYLSKYVELKPLNSTTAQSVITVMKSIYATHGIPEEFVSDGGPLYNSNLMMNFFREWGIKHHVTPPHFPRANGQIERAEQTVKNSLTKAAEEGKDLYVVLLDTTGYNQQRTCHHQLNF